MVCQKCGFDNPEENNSCRVCGAELSTDSVQPSETDTPSAVSSVPTYVSASTNYAEGSTECPNHPEAAADVICDSCAFSFCNTCAGDTVPPSGARLCYSCFKEAVFRTDFCPECAADMTFAEFVGKGDDDAGYWGKTGQCPKCNSVVRTRWLMLIFLPLIPLGSYRFREGLVRDEEEEETREIYQRGRTRMRWDQVFRTAMFFYIPIVLFILIVTLYGSVRPAVQ